ncbi:hypothetical protein RRG08_023874 [Elysia crispata]|uniref:Uncharacterized protein n=1 Tax=Elysia crispata TaxID=231223 RepID=A0AAE1AVA7_9GAST|nr:hypothetical protein RRG08_023874 [Elysia crispata]
MNSVPLGILKDVRSHNSPADLAKEPAASLKQTCNLRTMFTNEYLNKSTEQATLFSRFVQSCLSSDAPFFQIDRWRSKRVVKT